MPEFNHFMGICSCGCKKKVQLLVHASAYQPASENMVVDQAGTL
jgi:hypothetical protein